MHVVDRRAGADAAPRSSGVLAVLGRMLRRRAIYRELMSLDDRLLADIGLTRGDVAAVAHRAAEEDRPGEARAQFRPFAFVRALIERIGEARRRQAAMDELMALDERILADIGLVREDIPAAVGFEPQFGWLKNAVASMALPVRLWQRSNEAAHALKTLDDRALADAGMLRGEIGWVATELAERSLTPANRNGLTRAA